MNRLNQFFTLAELLVVMAIIAILFSMFMPAMKKAKESGKRTLCAGNLKQIGAVATMYTGDYNGFFPTAMRPASDPAPYNWVQILDSEAYLKKGNIYVCSSWYPYKYLAINGFWYTYGMRANGNSGAYRGKCYNIMQISSPSKFILFADTMKNDPVVNYTQASTSFFDTTDGPYYPIHLRHLRSANAWFTDGSTRTCNRPDLIDYDVRVDSISY